MEQKNIVTAIYPDAYFDGDDAIWAGSSPTPNGEEILGFGDTETKAWADAASRINKSLNDPI